MRDPKANNVLVESLGSALRDGEHGLSTVPSLLKQVLEEGSWREFVTRRGQRVTHDRFVEFVSTPPLSGLGATVELVRRVVADDPDASRMLTNALKGQQGRRTDINNNIIDVPAPQGTSRDRALRKLEACAPELLADVLAGRISPHAAMVQAGFRPKTFTVRADRPDSVARALRKYLTAEQLVELRRLLAEGGDN